MDVISHVIARRIKRVVEKPVYGENTLGRLNPNAPVSSDGRTLKDLGRYQIGTEQVDVMRPPAKLILTEDIVVLLR